METVFARAGGSAGVGPFLLGFALICAVLLVLPGRTVTTAYLNDLVIFLDAAHRIAWGQVPNRDFHSALGPLTYYIAAAGYRLTGSFGAALPAGIALITLALAPLFVHILASRLGPVLALLSGTFLLLVVLVPMNPGESIASLSFAMFYNRIGWVALGALLVMYLRPLQGRPHREWLDGASAALLTLTMLYIKATYGLVALAFLLFMLSDRRQRRWAAGALGIVLLAVLLIEIVWQSSAAYLADILLAGKVSGSRGPDSYVAGFVSHLANYALFGVLAGLALWRTRRLRDLAFFGFCAASGLLIHVHNSQSVGIMTLQAGAVVAAGMLLRSEASRPQGGKIWRLLAPGLALLVVALLLLPTTIHYARGLATHTFLAATPRGQSFGLPAFDGVRFVVPWTPGEYGFMITYLETLQDGGAVLSGLPERPERVSVLDFANPFSAGLGLPPPRGDNSWMHWQRNISAQHFPPPEDVFRDVKFLMVPKWGINPEPLRGLYGAYVGTAFEPVRESRFWIVMKRRASEADTLAGPDAASGPCAATERTARFPAESGCPQ
jgi:hypothetical protein